MKRLNSDITRQGDLIARNAFQRIVDALMDGEIAPELKARMQRHVRSEADEQKLEAAFMRYAETLEPNTGELRGEDLESYNKLAARLGLKPATQNVSTVKRYSTEPLRRRHLTLFWRVAAVLVSVMIVGGGLWWYGQYDGIRQRSAQDTTVDAPTFVAEHTVKAEPDSVRIVTLPDGTEVTLNRNATFSYNDHREGELDGEAYFKVAKDPEHPFVVHSEFVDVTVLGTEFNFHSQMPRLSLYTGIVELKYKSGISRLDEAGNGFTIDRATGAVDVFEFDASRQPEWVAAYRQELGIWSLGEIFDMMEARYGVRVENRDAIDTTAIYTFSLDGADSVDSIMRALEMANDRFDYTIEGATITLDKKQ